MSELNHTHGPWICEYGSVYTANGKRLLQADREEPATMPIERDANVRLAAAVPDMLEALEEIARCIIECQACGGTGRVTKGAQDNTCPWCNGTGEMLSNDTNELVGKVKDVIAKATGTEP